MNTNFTDFQKAIMKVRNAIDDAIVFLDDDNVAEFVYETIGTEYANYKPVFSITALIDKFNEDL